MPSQARCARVPPPHAYALLDAPQDDLPLDPRTWDRPAVGRWVSRRGGAPDRFPMNGKALCLMTEDMFCARVPKKGRVMYIEFRRRLAEALTVQDLLEKMSSRTR